MRKEQLQEVIKVKQRMGDMQEISELIEKSKCFYAWIKDRNGYDTNEGYIFPEASYFTFIRFEIGDANYKYYIS